MDGDSREGDIDEDGSLVGLGVTGDEEAVEGVGDGLDIGGEGVACGSEGNGVGGAGD